MMRTEWVSNSYEVITIVMSLNQDANWDKNMSMALGYAADQPDSNDRLALMATMCN